jgi:hypothetical protein
MKNKIVDLETLRKKCIPAGEKPEPGFYTMAEYVEAWGISESRTHTLLKRAVQAGAMEKKMFKVMSSGNQLRLMSHFKDIS